MEKIEAIVSYSLSTKSFRLIQRMTSDQERQELIKLQMQQNIKAHNSDEIIIELSEELINIIK